MTLRIGIAHHFGWAVAVTAGPDHRVVDRRRIELIEPGVAAAPIHHEGASLDDSAVAALVDDVRASAQRATAVALTGLAAEVPLPIVSLSLRGWPADFPRDLATLRRPPYEARADSVTYREVLADCARDRGWDVRFFEAKDIESRAAEILGAHAEDVLHGPRAALGPPWNRDHRIALAAAVVAAGA
ncbi:MAG: hypothetical protein AAGA17_17795 [Actinomycetota bacterium]